MMILTDTVFFKCIKTGMKHLLQTMKNKYPNTFTADVDHVLKTLMTQATNLDNYCFTHVPGLKHVPWPDEAYKMFMNNFKEKVLGKDRYWIESNYICNVIKGTTFSGHPTKTTLGNTLRSLCYAYYYCLKAGVKNPWDNPEIFIMAAGDDVVIFCDPKWVEPISNSVLRFSSRFKGTEP